MIESDVLSWNSKVANAILAQVQGTSLGEVRERAPSEHSSSTQVHARRRPRRRRGITLVLPGSLTKTPCVESLVAHCLKTTVDSISEEVLGIDRKLPEATRSESCCESAPCPCQTSLGQRSRQIVTAIERLRAKIVAGKLL